MDDIQPSLGERGDDATTFFDSSSPDCLSLEPSAGARLAPTFTQDRDLSSFYDQLMQQNDQNDQHDASPPQMALVASPREQLQRDQQQHEHTPQQQQQQHSQHTSHHVRDAAASSAAPVAVSAAGIASAESLAAALMDPSSDVGNRLRCSGLAALSASEQQLLLAALQKEAQGSLQPLQPFPLGTGTGTGPGAEPAAGNSLPRVRSSGASPAASYGEYAGAAAASDNAAAGQLSRTAHRKSASFSVGQGNAGSPAAMSSEPPPLAASGGLRSRRGLPDLHQVRGSGMDFSSGSPLTRPSPTGKRDADGNLVVSTPGRYSLHGPSPRGPLQVAEAQVLGAGLGASGLGTGGGSGGSGDKTLSPEAVLAVELSKIGVTPAVIAAATRRGGGGFGDQIGNQMGSGSADGSNQWGRGNQNPSGRGSMRTGSGGGGEIGHESSKRHAGGGGLAGTFPGMFPGQDDSPPGGSGSVSSRRSLPQQQQSAGGAGQQHQPLQKQGSGSDFSMDTHTEGGSSSQLGFPATSGGGGGGNGGGSAGAGILGYSTKPRSIAERLRREKITARLQTLKEVLPKMDAKTDTSAMLEDAVVYIQSLQARCKALERQNGALTQQLRDVGITPAVVTSNPPFHHQ